MYERATTHGQQSVRPVHGENSRVVDTAVGILIGWHRCSTHTAFRELASVSDRYDVPIVEMAAALVNLASRGTSGRDSDGPAHRAAELQWGLTYLL